MKTTVHRTSASIAEALCTPSPVHSTSVVLNGVHRRSAPKECRLQVVCTPFFGAPDRLYCHVEHSTRLRLTTCICTAARSLWLQFWITLYVYGGTSRRISKLSRRRVPENSDYTVKNVAHANSWTTLCRHIISLVTEIHTRVSLVLLGGRLN